MVSLSVVGSLAEVDAEAWDALGSADFPFASHAFLRLLETSKSVGRGTGWTPSYVCAHEGKTLIGAMPSYLRSDSYGEYIFDWAWAQAAARAGIPYYPKITVAIPFTPATGPRFFVHPEVDRDATRTQLLAGLRALAQQSKANSTHVLLCLDEEASFFAERGFLRRATHQYHFRNPGYADYEAFLAALKSSARKQLRKERRRIAEQEIRIAVKRGDELSQAEWATIFELYTHTSGRKWGRPYLTEEFFAHARSALGSQALAVIAYEKEQPIAMSLSFVRGCAVFGRYWGAFVERDSLHFELCYHQLIDYAIANGLRLVEAGAQGEHKLKRGFVPVITHSAHLIEHRGLADAIARAVHAENEHLQAALPELSSHAPFREDAIPPYPPLAGIPLP